MHTSQSSGQSAKPSNSTRVQDNGYGQHQLESDGSVGDENRTGLALSLEIN